MNVCVTLVPSDVTSVFTSRSSCRPELTKRTFFTLSAASFAASSSAILSSSGTSIGSRCTGVIHVPLTGVAGASSTGRRCTVRAARDKRDGFARRGLHAGSRSSCWSPRIPSSRSTSVRTPRPYDSSSADAADLALASLECTGGDSGRCARPRTTRRRCARR